MPLFLWVTCIVAFESGYLKWLLAIVMSLHNQVACILDYSQSTALIVVKYSKAKKSSKSASFGQQVSHNATCSLRYERQGQRRTTPGLAARQLNSSGWLCNRHVLSAVSNEGARMLSRDTVELHRKLFLKFTKIVYFMTRSATLCANISRRALALLTRQARSV